VSGHFKRVGRVGSKTPPVSRSTAAQARGVGAAKGIVWFPTKRARAPRSAVTAFPPSSTTVIDCVIVHPFLRNLCLAESSVLEIHIQRVRRENQSFISPAAGAAPDHRSADGVQPVAD